MKTQNNIQVWQEIVQKQKDSGLTISAFCKAEKIPLSSFYSWKKQLTTSNASNTPSIHPVVLAHPKQITPMSVTVTLANGTKISLPIELTSAQITRWMTALLC